MMPTPTQWLFSAKLFASAILAFFIAARLGAPQPYWAMVTCCVVMSPLRGAIWSKATYRIAGTAGGGLCALALTSLFGNTPALMVLATGIVVTVVFGLSFLNRTPSAYALQLFAITLLLIILAGVDHPERVFETAMARLTEISIGLLSLTVVDSIIAPKFLSSALPDRLGRWIPEIETWIGDVLAMRPQADANRDRLRALTDLTALSQLVTNLRYDSSVSRRDIRCGAAIQHRLLKIVLLLSEIEDRMASLASDARERLNPALASVAVSIHRAEALDPSIISQAQNIIGQADPWDQMAGRPLASLLSELTKIWREVRAIEAVINDHSAKLHPALAADVRRSKAFPLPGDLGFALRMTAGVALAYCLMSGFWLITGWQQAPNSLLLGTVALAFFGGVDEPGKAIGGFARLALIATILAAILNYGLLPLAKDTPSFILVMGLYMLPLGCWAAANPMAIMVLAYGLSNINLQGSYNPPDFAFFLEGCVASLIGIYTAFASSALFRKWGSQHESERLRRAGRADIARLSRIAGARSRQAFVERAVHRIVGLATRMKAAGQADQTAALLSRMRAGADVAELRISLNTLDASNQAKVRNVLARIPADIREKSPPIALLARIDEALSAVATSPSIPPASIRVIDALAGLRIALFARAPTWEPST